MSWSPTMARWWSTSRDNEESSRDTYLKTIKQFYHLNLSQPHMLIWKIDEKYCFINQKLGYLGILICDIFQNKCNNYSKLLLAYQIKKGRTPLQQNRLCKIKDGWSNVNICSQTENAVPYRNDNQLEEDGVSFPRVLLCLYVFHIFLLPMWAQSSAFAFKSYSGHENVNYHHH